MTETEAKKPRLDVENEGVNNGSGKMFIFCIFNSSVLFRLTNHSAIEAKKLSLMDLVTETKLLYSEVLVTLAKAFVR